MKDLLAYGLLIQIFVPFLVTCIFTLLGFYSGRWWGRRQGYAAGWRDRGLAGKPDPYLEDTWCGATKDEWTALYESASGGDE